MTKTSRMAKTLAAGIAGCFLLLPLSGQARSPLEIPSITDQHVRLTGYAGIVEPDAGDRLTGMNDWLEAKGVMQAHLSASGYVYLGFLRLAKDGTFQQGTRHGRWGGRAAKARTGHYEIDSENHLLILKDEQGITLKKDGTPEGKYVQIPVSSQPRIYHMARYYRDWHSENPGANVLHEELPGRVNTRPLFAKSRFVSKGKAHRKIWMQA